MSKRYYVSKIVGDGLSPSTAFDLSVARAFAASGTPANVTKVFPGVVAAGGWGLAVVASANHAPGLSDPGSDVCPDVSLDLKLSAIKAATWNALVARVQNRYGIDLTTFSAAGNSADAFRDVVRHLGDMLQGGFSETTLDALDP